MTTNFAPKVANYPKNNPKPKIAQNCMPAYCLVPLAMQLV